MASSSEYDNIEYTPNWTRKQNKQFEVALTIHREDTPDKWEKIAEAVDGKSAEEVKIHYEILVEMIKDIESGKVPIPDYKS
ncbi:protein RADIALIS-like 6-like [Trifolium medium]|uniref:Protein RADIALIS-like 6-like n=1 Tax=Trifolium medium TaxID=97028 RepID=A0A392Q5T2_9FABA|nr:protein RADIALIS-like 6-like [Trifolium medium]